MSEEASVGQVAVEPSGEQGAQTFINDEGKLQPGWKEHYLPEEMRTDKVFDTFDDVAGGLKMLGNVQNMIGKKGIIVPGEASPEAEWDNFYRELGRPDTKDQYEMKIADDLAEHYNENLVAKAREVFHALGFNQKQVEGLWALEEERCRFILDTNAKTNATAVLEMENFYKEEYKDDWETMKHMANRVISENVDNPEEQAALCELVGNNPVVGKFLGTISKKFMEHKIITDHEDVNSTLPSEALVEAKKIEQTPGFVIPDEKGQLLRDTNRPEYDRLEKERDRLYKIANP